MKRRKGINLKKAKKAKKEEQHRQKRLKKIGEEIVKKA